MNMKRTENMALHFWKNILLLPFGRRLVFFGAVFTLIFLFFPWLSASIKGEEGVSGHNAFAYLPIFGIITMGIGLSGLLIVLREIFSKKGFIGSVSHGQILIFLFGHGVYTILIATFVFHEFASQIPFSEVNIGLGLTFVSLGIGLAGSIFSKDYIPKGADRKVFAEPHEIDPSSVTLHPEDSSQLSFDEQP
ncbi:MAG: hypothetical protein WCJ84_01705 [Candidatus Peregrinibacteria bacterium]